MKIETEKTEQVIIIKLTGELDASNVVQVDAELALIIAKAPENLWIDGTGLSYISSAGLGVFLSHLQPLSKANIRLLFFGLNPKIRNVFTILGLDSLVQVVEDRSEAETQLEEMLRANK